MDRIHKKKQFLLLPHDGSKEPLLLHYNIISGEPCQSFSKSFNCNVCSAFKGCLGIVQRIVYSSCFCYTSLCNSILGCNNGQKNADVRPPWDSYVSTLTLYFQNDCETLGQTITLCIGSATYLALWNRNGHVQLVLLAGKKTTWTLNWSYINYNTHMPCMSQHVPGR